MSQTYTVGEKTFCLKDGNELRPGVKHCNRCGEAVIWPLTQHLMMQQPTTVQPPSNPIFSNGQQPGNHAPGATATGHPLRVIAMQKKFTLVACLKDLILPGNGFMYTEKMVEGGTVGLITIPLTVWAIIHYIQLWFSDVLNNLRYLGSGYPPDFSISNGFFTMFLIIALVWFGVRCLWLWYCIQEHNMQITKLADSSQIITFVDGK